MSLETVKKDFWFYNYLHGYVKWVFNIYFDVSVDKSLMDAKKGDAIIFAANHQNALIDPLAVLFSFHKRMLFYARADIFKNKFQAEALHSLKMLPVFRIRDGYDQIKKNDEIFEHTLTMVSAGQGLLVFPEASHFGQKHLRPLKKGLVRVAFNTQQKYPNKDVLIVPVGIEYSHYHRFRSSVHLKFGSSIRVSQFMDSYAQDGPKALNQCNKLLFDSLKELVLHIDAQPIDYPKVELFLEIFSNNSKANYQNRFISHGDMFELSRKILKSNPHLDSQLLALLDQYQRLLNQSGVSDNCVVKRSACDIILSYAALILASPVFVLGTLANILPFLLALASRIGFKDKQFYSTISLVIMAFVGIPLFYSAYLAILWSYFGALLALISMPILFYSGLTAFEYYQLAAFEILSARYRLFVKKGLKNKMEQLRDKISEKASGLIST